MKIEAGSRIHTLRATQEPSEQTVSFRRKIQKAKEAMADARKALEVARGKQCGLPAEHQESYATAIGSGERVFNETLRLIGRGHLTHDWAAAHMMKSAAELLAATPDLVDCGGNMLSLLMGSQVRFGTAWGQFHRELSSSRKTTQKSRLARLAIDRRDASPPQLVKELEQESGLGLCDRDARNVVVQARLSTDIEGI